MNVSSDTTRLSPTDKAAIIYSEARGDISARLWRAALGSDDRTDDRASTPSQCPEFDLDSMLSLLMPKDADRATAPPASPIGISAIEDALDSTVPPGTTPPPTGAASGPVTGLGPNARYSEVLGAAATRTGIPAAALAAIVDAEAGKNCDGSWKTASRNPRSSAAGLGQFLGGTWQGEAERAGTWLHGVATDRGWLASNGRVLPAARSALLALRYDGAASINATADYAMRSVAQLKHAGITIGEDVANVARAAYLGHHLGTGDAIRFLRGGLDSGRAKILLGAQVGSTSATVRIAQAGNAATAHRSWLLDFVDRHVTPARFSS